MSQELVQKKIRIASKTLDKINQLIADYEIENESALYREFIEIGFAIKKKQLDGEIGNGHEYLKIDAAKQAKYHSLILEKMASKILNMSNHDLSELVYDTSDYNHEVLADKTRFHEIDKEIIKALKLK
jgi:hypothetical protein